MTAITHDGCIVISSGEWRSRKSSATLTRRRLQRTVPRRSPGGQAQNPADFGCINCNRAVLSHLQWFSMRVEQMASMQIVGDADKTPLATDRPKKIAWRPNPSILVKYTYISTSKTATATATATATSIANSNSNCNSYSYCNSTITSIIQQTACTDHVVLQCK